MYYDDGYLHAVVEGLPGEAGPSAGREGEPATRDVDGEVTRDVSAAAEGPECTDGDRFANATTECSTNSNVDADAATEGLATAEAPGLSRRQRQKLERKLKKKQMKQQARDLKRRRQSEGSATEGSAPLQRKVTPLRLHQFISTAFRSELNVAENGTGHFVKNGPRASAHHAILQGVVRVNGEVCKLGRTALQHGDVISLQLEDETPRMEGELISWRGSAEVAKSLEGNAAGNGKRLSRMASSADAEPTVQKDTLVECEMVKYYREKLAKVWVPELHESAMARPLLLTLRVLIGTPALDRELSDVGFRPVSEDDVSLQVGSLGGSSMRPLSKAAMQELLRDTWILDDSSGKRSEANEKRLGVFLSEARVTGEVLQQELTSMIPVAVLASHLKKQTIPERTNLQLLDLCAAPGSKTCQLMSALEQILPTDDTDGVDFTVVANELNPQRANWMRHRLHQQSGGGALSNLIVTCADGRDYAKMQPNSFDYIICDVPCSGDGTVRKSPKILTVPGKWSPKNAEKNKPVQKELLKVGLDLLKPSNGVDGGILVYSTCSLNPAENEEAITEVLEDLNGNGESSFRFELVGLSDSESGAAHKDILRVLPARAHGGFFVAGIRKLVTSRESDTIRVKREESNDMEHELVQQIVGSSEKATMSYAISPGTRICHKEITDTMGNEAIVSCGVAVIREDAKGKHILQQDCAALVSPIHRGLVGYAQLSRAEMAAGFIKHPAFRELVLSVDKLRYVSSLALGTPLIVEVGSALLLHATILKAIHQNPIQGSATTATESVAVKILARPQVLQRALALP
ncbi:hypothetical protein ACHAXT_005584 [Thalassiosira profunda]